MSGTLEGQVLNQRANEPMEGVDLSITGEAEAKTTSGSKGAFKFSDLKEGAYELVAKQEGFEDGVYGPLTVVAENATKITIALCPKLE